MILSKAIPKPLFDVDGKVSVLEVKPLRKLSLEKASPSLSCSIEKITAVVRIPSKSWVVDMCV
jgi:hypothetical protein